VCEDNKIPYIFVPSKEVGAAVIMAVAAAAAVMVAVVGVAFWGVQAGACRQCAQSSAGLKQPQC
jgi:ribosomal protein L7Ae-like RNA K-turn-binding protein